jgi:oxaloacetate decarboxylase alpha subunit
MVESTGAAENARLAKALGCAEVVCGLVYSISPIHTDEFYAAKARELDACEAIDGIYLKDPGGLLTPERLATLLPAVRGALHRLKVVEIHTHCNTGVAPRTLLDAADAGIPALHCAVGVASNGSSHSPVRATVSNLAARGHNTRIDLKALEDYEHILQQHAAEYHLPTGHPVEYDETYYRHQLPGGMVSTTLKQLQDVGKEALLPAVMEEVVEVRRDFGYPIMVTPLSQFMVSQALLNVLSEHRYDVLSDETVLYLLGDFGSAAGEVNADLLDRAVDIGRARQLSVEKPQPSLSDLRAQFGADLSDEELLLSALISEEEVRKVRHGSRVVPPSRTSEPAGNILALLEHLKERPDLHSFSMTSSDLSLTMRR